MGVSQLLYMYVISLIIMAYVCLVKTRSIHTYPNTIESIKKFLHEKQMTQGYTCISNSFKQFNKYMKLNI